MKHLRLLLFPFSLLYGLVVIIRNWCFDAGLLKSRQFDLPIISVGNLEVGGAGKSPMTEYLIRLFKNDYKLATLSRGYGRKTKGYLVATDITTATQIGDEPAQFKHKFKDITVAVCEKRVEGIVQLQTAHQLILMDDAYQHRAVKAGLSILLFDYNKINQPHLLLPAGNLREPFRGRWRADIIVISKCPAHLSENEKTTIAEKIVPLSYQSLFFTAITYMPLQDRQGSKSDVVIDADTTVFLLTGIANAKPMVAKVSAYTSKIIHHNYPDHHQFSLKNITKLADEFYACEAQKKVIITTEKDAQRLVEQDLVSVVNKLPILVLPIGVRFLDNSQQQFDQLVTTYVREHKANHGVY